MVTRILGTVICSLFLAAAGAWADVRLSVQPRLGSQSQTFTFGITITDDKVSSPPVVEDSDDFTVRYVGPQQSVKIINGSVSSETTFFYKLKPKREGTLSTPTVTVTTSKGAESPD